MVQEIIKYENDILRTVCKEVKDVNDSEVQQVITNLKDTLRDCDNGCGLAAPQINSDLRIFAMKFNKKITIYINPEVKSFDLKHTCVEPEGCLSIPGICGRVRRPKTIRVSYLDEVGKSHASIYYNFKARCFLHEYDHLGGTLFIDRIE